MAILRGGKRIGGYDVRIGIPRDRSLDDVAGDTRLQRRMGSNPETTIGRFQSYVNEAEGFARKARFYAEFNLPKGVSNGALFSEGFTIRWSSGAISAPSRLFNFLLGPLRLTAL